MRRPPRGRAGAAGHHTARDRRDGLPHRSPTRPDAEARFFRAIANGEIRVDDLTDDELDRVADLIERYRDLPLGGTDASLVVLAERHGETRLGTLDHRHFRVVRPAHAAAFELVP